MCRDKFAETVKIRSMGWILLYGNFPDAFICVSTTRSFTSLPSICRLDVVVPVIRVAFPGVRSSTLLGKVLEPKSPSVWNKLIPFSCFLEITPSLEHKGVRHGWPLILYRRKRDQGFGQRREGRNRRRRAWHCLRTQDHVSFCETSRMRADMLDPCFPRRYVDLRIVPILAVVYSFSLIDRINLGAAYTAGMGVDLVCSTTIFFIFYFSI